ncbi:MAG: rod shape-determining protein MreD [Anaerolineales bacterium]|jgi:rod shape-determining protein MreD
MAYLIGVPLLALLAILQSTMFADFGFYDGRPDLVLLAVTGWALTGEGEQAMLWGFIGGLFLDMLSALPLGTSSIALILVAYLVSLYSRRIWEVNLLMPLGVTLIASILFHSIMLLALLLFGRQIQLDYAFIRVILPSTFINLLLTLPISQGLAGLQRRIYPPEVEV